MEVDAVKEGEEMEEEAAADRANTPPQLEGQEGGQATGKRKGCASVAAVRNPGSVPLGIKP